MNNKLLFFLCALIFSNAEMVFSKKINSLESYNVNWTTPSPDAWESMPLSGRYGAGANVWVQDGALWLYLAHNMAYDEGAKLLKLGALRITPVNYTLNNLVSFSQNLDIQSGSIKINAVSKNGVSLQLKLWFAGENLIIESKSSSKTSFEISFGSWRDVRRDGLHLDLFNHKYWLNPDDVSMTSNGIVWAHHNNKYESLLPSELKVQHFAVGSIYNPTENNVFGGAIVCNMPLTPMSKTKVDWQRWSGSAWSVQTAESKAHTIVAALRAGQNLNPEQWQTEAKAFLNNKILKAAAKNEQLRWDDYWNRSYIFINKHKNESDSAWVVGRNYQLFRYMLATNQNGKLPLLFNGGIFTVDNFDKIKGNNNDELSRKSAQPSTPDLRHWLFCNFMAQNQRWLGWPTIAAGDTDLLEASNAFYRNHAASGAARARVLSAKGVVFPEPINVWRLSLWPTATGQCSAPHLKFAFAMMLENAWMTLNGHTTLGKDISSDMEWIKGTVRFFDTYYRNETMRLTGQELDMDGRLSIYPANAIELLIDAKNPTEVVAGLMRITDALTQLPETLVSTEEKKYFAHLIRILPDLPMEQKEGKTILKPALSWKNEYNLWELPEFYVAWPYRLKGVSHPGTEQLLTNTWELLPTRRFEKVNRDYSWMPVVVNMAAMGNTEEAAKRIVAKLGNFNPQARFPAFFGPGHDWVPDHNWGGSGMVGLQEMLMAANPYGDGKIYLLPAWPTKWDVDFKLHAPEQTIIEASVKNAKIVRLKVTPENRRMDIVINPNFDIAINAISFAYL